MENAYFGLSFAICYLLFALRRIPLKSDGRKRQDAFPYRFR